jgi:hypothetical protein
MVDMKAGESVTYVLEDASGTQVYSGELSFGYPIHPPFARVHIVDEC